MLVNENWVSFNFIHIFLDPQLTEYPKIEIVTLAYSTLSHILPTNSVTISLTHPHSSIYFLLHTTYITSIPFNLLIRKSHYVCYIYTIHSIDSLTPINYSHPSPIKFYCSSNLWVKSDNMAKSHSNKSLNYL